MRTRAKADTNQPAIVAALRRCGWLVEHVKYPCDLLLYWRATGRVYLAEVKRDDRAVRYTETQQRLMDEGWELVTLQTLFDVSELTRLQRSR